MLKALPAGQPPRLVGPYRLLAALGAGGMGEVHLACRADAPTADPQLMVAVKTVRADLEVDGDFRTRFRREITAARAVSGPYAARLVDADADAAVPWLATEYVPGPSLAEAVTRTGPLPVEAVRALGAALARALESVHTAKVLHRDLKPANVLLGAAGPKLIDFGIAQAFEATALTSTGLVVGSPGFMSPEHLVGSRAVVPASDVFCLGAVLAFAASGRGPFHDEEMASVIFRISRAQAELDGVPVELRPAIERCLELDPAERPTAAELAALLGGEAPTTFPWPSGVLSLLAEYGDAARRIGAAAASGAGVADLPTIGPQVPYSPTDAGYRPPAASSPPEHRRRWAAIAASAVAVTVLVAGGVVLFNSRGEQGGSTGGAAGPTASPSGGPKTPAALSQVVLPYGGEGHGGDFGKAATDRASRPAGWSPWKTQVVAGTESCALAPKVLLCAGSGGSAVGLSAADGRKLWAVPAQETPGGEGLYATAGYPAVVGDTAYVSGPDGVTAYGLEDGRRKGRVGAPGGDWAVKGSDLLDGILYSTYIHLSDEGKGLVTALKLTGDGGRELWRHELDGLPEQPVAAGGRVYVPVGVTPVALDAGTGEETARAAEDLNCGRLVVRGQHVLCSPSQDQGVPVLDARTLRQQRTLGRGLTLAGGPAVSEDGLVAVLAGERGRTVVTYDLESGRERWRADVHWQYTVGTGPLTRVWFVGDRLVVGGRQHVHTIPVSGPTGKREEEFETFVADLPEGVDESELSSTEALAAGGAVFLPFSGGLVLSGYLP
ncbi:protein kinase domain-containing protein [Streptomyces tritici]|uniref:serine/threonine-protein kinase n=1 Tax=Streptomyces tritici TaxID=2054410 RepID=UPI003AF0F40A